MSRVIEDEWEDYREKVLANPMFRELAPLFRDAFYAGAAVTLVALGMATVTQEELIQELNAKNVRA